MKGGEQKAELGTRIPKEQHSSEFSRLIFCLIYPQLRVEAGKPEMSIGADKKKKKISRKAALPN